MKKILVLTACMAVSVLLGGCSDADWNNALNYTGLGAEDDAAAEAPVQAVPATAVAAAPAPDDSFCRDVATQDASGSGFDKQTQARVYIRSYQQCTAVYTH
jgi:hypothetical protein